MKKKNHWSPYTTKTLKSTKVNRVRVYLQAYQTKPQNIKGEPVPVTVFYYIVRETDGSRRKVMQYEDALLKYRQLVAFEKRQTQIEEGGAQ